MPSIGTIYPFGLRDLKFTLWASPNTQVDLPAAITLEFKEVLVSAQLQGDDALAAVHSLASSVEWKIDAGGINMDALALIMGRTVLNSGTTTTRYDTLNGTDTDAPPYFKIYGKSVGADGGDIHCKILKCKITEAPTFSFQNGEFVHSGITGIGIPDSTNPVGRIFQFVYNETAVALPAS